LRRRGGAEEEWGGGAGRSGGEADIPRGRGEPGAREEGWGVCGLK